MSEIPDIPTSTTGQTSPVLSEEAHDLQSWEEVNSDQLSIIAAELKFRIIHSQVARPLETHTAEPCAVGTPLRAPFDEMAHARRGEYRIRIRIGESGRLVFVPHIDHRCDACRT